MLAIIAFWRDDVDDKGLGHRCSTESQRRKEASEKATPDQTSPFLMEEQLRTEYGRLRIH